jgi:hypothetical protein
MGEVVRRLIAWRNFDAPDPLDIILGMVSLRSRERPSGPLA